MSESTQHIRNFSIIAHIDHGKSTLADRMLELTSTIEERRMQEQVLDSMELERERGITIKMQPVQMQYKEHTLNLIDTPGHIDFSYEVSRALKAVEGSILLVDATQGVQAQTLTTLRMAEEQGLTIIPVITKTDMDHARIDDVKLEIAEILSCDLDDIMEVSGKTGKGVIELLDTIIERIPTPRESLSEIEGGMRGLVFDFEYSNHKGIIMYVRIFDGVVKKRDSLKLHVASQTFSALEIGSFMPEPVEQDRLTTGTIGYIVTGIKEAGVALVGDTVISAKSQSGALAGYQQPSPVVWASLYPVDADQFDDLTHALKKLRLSDSSFTYEEESSATLGRGYRIGFLGMLHLEIISERLKREWGLDLVVTTPSVTYRVITKKGDDFYVYSPAQFPSHGDISEIYEPYVSLQILTPNEYISGAMQLLHDHESNVHDTKTFGDGRVELSVVMPLRELMRNFFDELKSVTSGYASVSYEITDEQRADVTRLDILVAGDEVSAFSRVVSSEKIQGEATKAVEALYKLLPQQMFVVKIQAVADGRIVASKTLKALRKDVTGHLYGGDITRKMKLREKQKKGKKRMAGQGSVNIPQEVYVKMMRE